ncbi:MAG TPA: hypothetical protein VGS41_09650 [Chthonomonadales bacterium]|nr:hypothetical protein [Chthonomonadales bacterium]
MKCILYLTLIFAPAACRADVWLPPSEAVGPAPAHAGCGLTCAYYRQFAEDDGKAERLTAGGAPQCSFLSTAIDYPAGGGQSYGSAGLPDFLGADGASLQASKAFSNLFSVFRFTGYIKIAQSMDADPRTPEIEVTFALASVDGARLKIGGEIVAANNGAGGYRVSTARVHFKRPGLYPIELLYYPDFNKTAAVRLFSTIAGRARKDAPRPTIAIVPADILYPSPPPSRIVDNPAPSAITAGWSDEFSAQAVWTSPFGPVKLHQVKPGVEQLQTSKPRFPGSSKDYSAQITRDAVVDLDQFPWLALRVVGTVGKVEWALGVQGVAPDGSLSGEVRSALQTRPGIVMMDIVGLTRVAGERKVRITIHLSGDRADAGIDMDWIRFLHGQDTPYVEAYPYAPAVAEKPPSSAGKSGAAGSPFRGEGK